MPITVTFQPSGRRVTVKPGSDLLEAAQRAGVDLNAVCGGVGICGMCRIRLLSGRVTSPTPDEQHELTPDQLSAGLRLACQCRVETTDVLVDVPPESALLASRLQTEGDDLGEALLDPPIRWVDVRLDPPDHHDLRADLTRLQQALSRVDPIETTTDHGNPGSAAFTLASQLNASSAALALASQLNASSAMYAHASQRLRAQNWQARIALFADQNETHLAGVLPYGASPYGMAVDIGSTKLAAYLVNLETGAVMAQQAAMNPQIAYGEDVVSRIAFANQCEENRLQLQTRLVEELNQLVDGLAQKAGIQRDEIVDAVLVGNTIMHHLFLHLPVEQLGAAPYVPAVAQPLDLPAADVGLRLSPGAHMHLTANIAGYVGGDHVAALLATNAVERLGAGAAASPAVLVDIGTNTEISLVHAGRIFTCSTASGPAFEGAHIQFGMRAAAGAIERVRLTRDGDIELQTVGGVSPVGLCGTGILHAIAQLLDAGLLDMRGAFARQGHPALIKNAFVLAAEQISGHGQAITLSRSDVHEIQLAKGAIRTGIDILLEAAGLSALEIGDWFIAGAFGTYLDLYGAVRIGMFPDVPLERFHQVGNAAGVGARRMLVSARQRKTAARLAATSEYIELTVHAGFSDRYLASMYFPA